MSCEWIDRIPQSDLSTDELVMVALRDLDSDEAGDAVGVLLYRATDEVFHAAVSLCSSTDTDERRLAAWIFGQIGFDWGKYLDKSVRYLLQMLDDADEEVLRGVGIALGHRADARAIEPLLLLKDHYSAEVRYGVVIGLMYHNEPPVVATMIELSRDPDSHVRDWATFALHLNDDMDTPEIRAAMFDRLDDEDDEVRGEAFVGLAKRKDRRIVPLLCSELEKGFCSLNAVEAAELLGDPVFLPYLKAIWVGFSEEMQAEYGYAFLPAIEACTR